jgi:hypothetical protein
MARRKKKRGVKKATGKRAKLSFERGHKPVALLESFHGRMVKNITRLERLIERRRAAGE